jgi:hypothetical protein
MRTLRLAALIAVVTFATPGAVLSADAVSGAWRMVKYEGTAAHGTASGMLLAADGHFSLTYTMDEGGQRWGRAHAGTYEVSGDRLTYHVEWSMEYVSGKPSVALKASDRETRFSVNGDTLTVTFTNGSVQTFKRER